MARYVDTALSAGEPILYDAKVHWAVFLEPFTKWIGTAVFLAIVWTFIGVRITGDLSENLADERATQALGWLSALSFTHIAVLIAVLIMLQSLIKALIYYYNSDFVLTDRRVISKFGLLSRTTSEQRLSKVESIHVYQSFLGRLLNYGTVTVTGTGSSATKFGPMADPIACKRAIETQLDLVKSDAG
jgi:uncharacterized membrane protein YdbT with pleckstrin-like domain